MSELEQRALRIWRELYEHGSQALSIEQTALEFARRLLAEQGEPVLERYDFVNLEGKTEKVYRWLVAPDSLPAGTTLYAAPPQDALDVSELERDLLTATSIGIALMVSRIGTYQSLSPYLKKQYDTLNALHAKCNGAFEGNIKAAMQENQK